MRWAAAWRVARREVRGTVSGPGGCGIVLFFCFWICIDKPKEIDKLAQGLAVGRSGNCRVEYQIDSRPRSLEGGELAVGGFFGFA